jgi:hypothetical protein
MFDNARVYRVATAGPQWQVRDINLFQDNFASDGTITGYVRADAAVDILPDANPNLRPGDSVTVHVGDPSAGMGYHSPGDPASGPAVYCYVSVWPQGQSNKTGGDIQAWGTRAGQDRWPYIDNVTLGGDTWYRFRMDSVFTVSGGTIADRYCIDLNDNLFTPGDTVGFVFGAINGSAVQTYYTRVTETTDIFEEAFDNPMEFTCLPAGGWQNGGSILYVDGMDGLGAQKYFDWAFEMLDIDDKVDRYDVRAPWLADGNGPGSRVRSVGGQLLPCYQTIIWNTGDRDISLGDCTGAPMKSDEYGLLFTFLEGLYSTWGGVYLSGDDLADSWLNQGGVSPIQLRSAYCNFDVLTGNHRQYGVETSPMVIGWPGRIFDNVIGPDSMVVYGGCPTISDFDMLQPSGTSTIEMYYETSSLYGAVISQQTTNPYSSDVRVVLSGFSFHSIRDDRETGIPDRTVHLEKILQYLGNTVGPPTATATAPMQTRLYQSHPNPFNPTTTINFSLRETSHVSLKIYNVAGQLVHTLVDETRQGQKLYSERWSGLNDAGQAVASGVYFYRLVADGMVLNKKAVLLK